MKRFILAALVVTTAHAADLPTVTVVKDSATVRSCTLLGAVSGQPPYWLPSTAKHQMMRLTVAMGGDTLLQVSAGQGVAYRCAK